MLMAFREHLLGSHTLTLGQIQQDVADGNLTEFNFASPISNAFIQKILCIH